VASAACAPTAFCPCWRGRSFHRRLRHGRGFFTLQPTKPRVGPLRQLPRHRAESGFFWTNPFNRKIRVSLRARNLNGEKLKVNEKRGNPIEIAVVVVWRVRDTAQACFDVENYDSYVRVQSESALRHVASSYAYDDGEPNEVTLRSGGDVVAAALTVELQERLARAGVEVQEAASPTSPRPEIAQTMLRRQQAEAVIAARQKIVHGAVSMVEMALNELSAKKVVVLDEERKPHGLQPARLLCGESETKPVINTARCTTNPLVFPMQYKLLSSAAYSRPNAPRKTRQRSERRHRGRLGAARGVACNQAELFQALIKRH